MKKWLQYLIVSLIALALAVCVLLINNGFQHSGQELFKNLSDAFFVPGFLVLGLGILVFATNGGAFDMLAFAVVKFIDLFKRDMTKVKYRTFYDYRKAQQEKARTFSCYIVVGIAMIVVAIVFFIIYYQFE